MATTIRLYQADAFTDAVFAGNPAAVCVLQKWLPDAVMQRIAMENNLAETAFLVPSGEDYLIRWFTPAVEVDLCGHATLASAFVLFNYEGYPGTVIRFQSPRSGLLPVTRDGERMTLDFPTDHPVKVEITSEISACFDRIPAEAYQGKSDLMLVFNTEEEIRDLHPVFARIALLEARGVIVTAPGMQVDFVSRFFAPQVGILEDPVTGSAHTTLVPYWSGRLGKKSLQARQISSRGGDLLCEYRGDRVAISGRAALFMRGEIFLSE